MTMQRDKSFSHSTADDQEPVHMLTTLDNPYNPFTQFDEWQAYDTQAGYYTLAYLARVTTTSSELSEADQDAAIESAMLEIIQENILGIYRLVSQPPSK